MSARHKQRVRAIVPADIFIDFTVLSVYDIRECYLTKKLTAAAITAVIIAVIIISYLRLGLFSITRTLSNSSFKSRRIYFI